MNNPVDQPKVSDLDARALESAQTRFVVTLGSKGRSYSPSEAVAEAITSYLAALPQPQATTVGVTDDIIDDLAADVGNPNAWERARKRVSALIGIPGAEKLVGWINGEREILCAWLSGYITDLKQNHVRNVDVILRLERLNSLLSSGAEKGEAEPEGREVTRYMDEHNVGLYDARQALAHAPPAPTSERVQALELLREALQAEWDEIQKLPLATGDRHEWDLARRARIRDALNHKSS